MLPRLKPGQLVIASSLVRPKVGLIVIIEHDKLEKIKRVSKIKGSKVYILGDNKPASRDSRQFGWLDKAQLIATVIWPKK